MTTSSGSKSLTTWLKKKIRPALSLQGSVAAYHRSPRHEVCNTQIVYCSNLEQIKNYSPKLSYALHNKLNLNKQLLRFVFPVMCVDVTVVHIVTKEALYEDAVGSLQLKLIEQGYQLNERSYLITDAAILLAARRILPSGEKELKQQHRSESYSMAQWSEAELHAMFIELVRWGVENEASDLHINLNLSAQFSDVLYTIAGRYIRPRVFHSIQTKLLKDMLAVVWMGIQGGNAAVFDAYQEQQGRLECQVNGQTVRLRWASLAALDGPSVCIRILKKQDKCRLTLKQLGYLPEQEKQLLEGALSERGAIIFSGSVGSGKSTALAALVRELPLWRKIITLEDPVEYRIPNAIQVSIARQLDGDSEQHFRSEERRVGKE